MPGILSSPMRSVGPGQGVAGPACAGLAAPLPGASGDVGGQEPANCRRLVWRLAAGAVALGALHAWAARHAMNADGISYIEIARAYTRGNWGEVVTGYWSPLYSWLLAAGFLVVRPSLYWEAAVVHLVNFGIYCAALAGFHFFWGGLLRWRAARTAPRAAAGVPVGPDVVGAGLRAVRVVVACAGEIAGGRAGHGGGGGCLCGLRVTGADPPGGPAVADVRFWLGGLLGVGYLTKAVLFPLSFVFLGVAACSAGNWRRAVSSAGWPR